MQTHSNTAQGQGSALPAASSATARRILPGDRVLIFDGLAKQNIWIIVDDVLIGSGRTKIRSANMTFYFDEGLVIAHKKGDHK
jgi:hypothetical protein